MHPKAIIRRAHWHLLGVDATFPIAPDNHDPDPEAVGSLDLGDRTIHEIQVVPERHFMLERTDKELSEFYPIACAVLDYKKGVIYTFNLARQHSDLISAFALSSGSEQTKVEQDLICGFVTANGHFFNRESMQYFVNKHHPKFLKKSKEEYFFNSSMINWKVAMDHLHERAVAD